MKNKDIITAKAREIFGDDAVDVMIANNEDIPLHTMNEWKKIYPSAVLRKDAEGHEVLLWVVNSVTCRLYRKKTRVYTIDEIVR